MNKKSYLILASILVTFTVFVGWLGSNVHKIPGLSHADPFVVQALVMVIGIFAAAIATWIMSKQSSKPAAGQAGGEAAVEEVTDLDELLSEAEARLAVAQQQKDS